MSKKKPVQDILLTGATGYIGGRLLNELGKKGHRIRCLVRDPSRLPLNVPETADILMGDVLDPPSLTAAMEGVHTAYYLVHSMGSRGDFEEKDRRAATNFAEAAKAAGIARIIYLGGLGNEQDGLSDHLRSRQDVGRILKASGAAVIEFRASIVIGCGSLSFEMIRSLVDRLPVMITPRWVSVEAQPIYIEDLLKYLLFGLDTPENISRIYEIGGADRVSYAGIMKAYADARGKKLRMLPVPVLTPHLSSLWLGLVTPLYARVGRRLIEGVLYSTVVRDDAAMHDFPFKPIGIKESINHALSGGA